MHHIQRLAILSAAALLVAGPTMAAPKVGASAGPDFVIRIQNHSPGFSGIGAFWGGGVGFGGGRYNAWPSAPPPPAPAPAPQPPPPATFQSPPYQAYQPQQQQEAPVASAAPARNAPAVRRTTFARPVPNAQPNYLATLSGVRGDDVSVRPAGGRFENVSSGRQLKASDEVSSGPDTEVTLTLRDGGIVRLSPATRIDLATLDSGRTNTKALVNLDIGEVSSKVTLGASTGYNFGIKTDRATIDVREASFTVRHNKQTDVTTVFVEEGVVQVTPANNAIEAVSLQAGQQADITADRINATAAPTQSADAGAPAEPTGTVATPSETKVNVIPVSAPSSAAGAAAAPPAASTAGNGSGDTKVTSIAPATDAAPGATAAAGTDAAPAAPTDLTGGWVTQDGSVVQLTQTGNKVTWNFRGPPGHEKRTGTISGTFDGRFVVGTFHFKEGKTSANGTVTLTMEDGNRLVGGWISTSPPGMTGETTLTRQ